MMTRRYGRTALLAAWVALGATAAQAADPVTVQQAWSRATPPGASTGAVYLTLTSPSGDTLVSASSPAATAAGVHEMSMDGTIMRMREVTDGLALPAGKPVLLEPGGYHIMLIGLKAPLVRGGTVKLHLTFANAPPLDISAPIAGLGASTPPMAGMKMN